MHIRGNFADHVLRANSNLFILKKNKVIAQFLIYSTTYSLFIIFTVHYREHGTRLSDGTQKVSLIPRPDDLESLSQPR